jgi:hypothetical protein
MDQPTLRESEISTLSDTQERLLSSLSLLSGSLSVLGSSMIVYLVIQNSRKTPYKRILLGLSLCDIVASITYAIQAFLLPADTSQRIWARGTDATCSFTGFLTQLAFSAIWYNGMLSYYYLLTVRFGVKTATMASRFEPWIHLLCVGYNLGTAIVGYAMGFYSEMELGQGCWIAEYPEGCEVTGDCTGATIGWIFGGLPTVYMFLSIIINNLLIYCFVRRTTRRTSRKSLRGRNHQQNRIQAVATQALLYVGTFLLAYSWAFAVKVAESLGFQAQDEARIFPVLVLQAIFLPMHGFFNLIVYSRPNYLRCRQIFPRESRLWVLRRAWFGRPIVRRLASVDASLASHSMSTYPAANIEKARQRAAAQFTATFSSKDPLRRDYYKTQQEQNGNGLFPFRSKQILNVSSSSSSSSMPDDDEEDRLPNVISEGEMSGRLDKNDDNPPSSIPPSENYRIPEFFDDEEDRLPNVISEGEMSERLDKNDDNPPSSMPPSENNRIPEFFDDPDEPESFLGNDDDHHEEYPAESDGDNGNTNQAKD